MQQALSVARLRPEQILQAFALVRTVMPDLPLGRWRRVARALASPGEPARCGIMAAQCPAGYLRGLFVYRVQPALRYRRLLDVEHIIALDIIDEGPVADALIHSLETLTAELGCDAVRTTLQPGGRRVLAGLHAAGHRVEAMVLSKVLPGSGQVPRIRPANWRPCRSGDKEGGFDPNQGAAPGYNA